MTTKTINTLKINGKDLELEDKLARDTLGEGFNTTDKTVAKSILAEKERAEAAEQTNATNITNIQNELEKSGGLVERLSTVETKATTIEEKIPSEASSSNQLADKAFVNSSIATSTATFRGTFDSEEELPTTGVDANDYAFVRKTDSVGNKSFDRFKFTEGSWTYEYTLNNSSFTADQWAAINSGITDVLRASYDSHLVNTNAHVTVENKATWDAKQEKLTPGDGISITKVGDDLVISSSGGVDLTTRVVAIENKLPMAGEVFGDKTVKEYIDATDAVLGKAIEDETTRATNAENALTANLNTEISRATAAEEALKTRLDTVEDVIPSEATSTNKLTDKAYVDVELAKKQNNLSDTQLAAVNSGITSEKVTTYDAHIADTDIHITSVEREKWNAVEDKAEQSDLEALSTRVTTAEDNIITLTNDKADKATTYTKTEVDSKVSEEATARTEADTALTTNLSNEETRAKEAEEGLEGKIDQEVTDRNNAILAETNRAKSVEGEVAEGKTLAGLISEEVTARAEADTTLTNNLASEIERAKGEESTLTTNLAKEISERKTAIEQEVADRNNAILAETTRAKSVEGEVAEGKTLAGLISEETTARGNADTALDTKFTGITDTLESSKQDKLTAGANIQITDNTISATDTLYTAGNGLSLNDTEFSIDTTVTATKASVDALAAIVGDEDSGLVKDLADEVLAREAADTTINEKIGEGFSSMATVAMAIAKEASDRENADETLQSAISAEEERATTVEEALDEAKADKATTLAGYGITDAYTKAEVDGKISGTFHYKGSVDKYSDLPTEGMLVGDVYNIKTADKAHKIKAGDNVAWNGEDWDVLSGVVDLSEYSTTEEMNTAIASAVSAEAGLREAADAELASDIEQEVEDRKSAINKEVEERNAAILVETNRATEAEDTLTTNLAKEVSDRKAAIEKEVEDRDAAILTETNRAKSVEGEVAEGKTLAGLISEEATARTNADSTLTTNLAAEENRATQAEEKLASDLADEVTRATGVEDEIKSSLESEVTRATDAEGELLNSITQEVSDRKAAVSEEKQRAEDVEDALDARITEAEQAIEGLDDSKADKTDVYTKAEIGGDFSTTNTLKAYMDNADTTLQTNIDSEASTRLAKDAETLQSAKDYTDGKVFAEETRAKAAEQTLTTNLESEVSRATAAEGTLTANLATEVTNRTNADTAINEKIGGNFTSTSTVAMAIAANTTAITNEATTRASEDTAIKAIIGTGFDSVNTVAKAIDTNAHAIVTEKTRAENAESVLTNNLATEVSTREAADTVINNKVGSGFDGKTITTKVTEVSEALSAEITRATGAEGGLNTRLTTAENKIDTNTANITQEIANRQLEDGKLDAKISSEATTRANADTELSNKLGTGFDSTNTVAKALSDEATNRASGDATTLQSAKDYADSKVLAEETRAKAAEQTLTTNLAKEVSDRTNADTAEATARVEGDATTLASAKTYTDEKVTSALTSVYRYKGTVQNYEELQNIFPRVQGDVYNVIEEHTTAPKFPAGANLAWVQTTETSGQWDVLGGTVDLTAYAKKEIIGDFTADNTVEEAIDALDSAKADKASTLAGYGITNAYTKDEVNSSLELKQNALTEAQLNATNSGITAAKVSNYDEHLSNTSNPHNVTKAQVGLENVDNTSDLNKPISTATQTALNLKANSADLATVATTGSFTDLTNKPVIDNALSDTSENAVQNKVIKAALEGKQPTGDYVTNTQLNEGLALKVDKTFTINGTSLSGSTLTTEQLLPAQSASTDSFILASVKEGDKYIAKWTEKGKTLPEQTSHANHFLTTDGTDASWVAVNKATVGLDNVDNTADLDKPVSTATQTALNGKADKATTLAGYNISDAYTKTEVDDALALKQDTIKVYKHTYFASDWVADGDMFKLSIPTTTHGCGEDPLVKDVLMKENNVFKKVPFSFNTETGVLDEGFTYEIDATGNVTIKTSTKFEAKVILANL